MIVHIYTITVAFYIIILFFSLSSPLPSQTLSYPLFDAKKKKKLTINIHPPSQLTNHHHNQPITTSI